MSLRVAYIPEHFSTPLFFAIQQKYFSFNIELTPVIEGSGRLINLLNANEVDIAIGLTEAFVADIAKGNEPSYKLVDTYVESPLCWAISTGFNRENLTSASQLEGKTIGVSRIGSGSYVMSFVLAHDLKFQKPFAGYPTLSNFKNLRDSVNLKYTEEPEKNSDAFMWEHFTSKKYYDNNEIKKIGEIYTPWPSWVINSNAQLLESKPEMIKEFVAGLNKGIEYFNNNHEEAIEFISNNLDYSAEDAREWIKTVKFNKNVGKAALDWERVVTKTSKVLKLAGVLQDSDELIEKRLNEGIVRQL
ncbi:uncharacterized protein CANTADRAFT_21514 [Suhomyces tanzawaensis NRRL Y-17324]|uniref:Ca3427-like PBP 2 domain-containing protein n=1 Tax=Suhomyces tanzawaensis NRRL Y-17324 TaxID=984487 RepID=A0A1E4SL99_9ASCO|nr:uncharacterized protein CANTADRAFT_21514 [Suhomyces tanzawaensis NRRL Y-17324]ODV80274.1 hypothetical protein CANTADRAFT_21514 [Suhomyces tanzawaensis NRRL Y-17324]